jgi:hypothetical protein
MNTDRKIAIAVGVLYILATAAPIMTAPFLGFLGGGIIGEPAPDYLAQLSAAETQVDIGMLVELVWALAVIGIPIALFPILKRYSEAVALGFFSLRFVEGISTVVGSVVLMTLLTVSQGFATAGAPDASHYQVLGAALLATRNWTFLIGSGIFFSLSALVLNSALYHSRFIPRWLSGWGLAGALLMFASYLLQLFGVSLDVLFIPIAVQEMVFALWLIVKGFNPSTYTSPSAKTG